MQNIYVGDIGDYGKYGLLRAVFPNNYQLGIVWYLVPNEHHLNDGRHIDYLSKQKYINCDSVLFSILKNIISSGKRDISEIERSEIFPQQTIYYSEYLTYDGVRANSAVGRQRRIEIREQWLNKSLEVVKNCDVVFLDPDNGLETSSVKKHLSKAPKYVYYDEIEKFLLIRNTLIIYHHLGRRKDHKSQIKEREKVLKKLAGNSYKVLSLRFRPYSPRAYFILTMQEEVVSRVNQFLESKWKQCFKLVG